MFTGSLMAWLLCCVIEAQLSTGAGPVKAEPADEQLVTEYIRCSVVCCMFTVLVGMITWTMLGVYFGADGMFTFEGPFHVKPS